MKLREWDWDAQGYAEVEYPDEIIKKFVDYFRVNKQWREDPELVYARWLVLERELTESRNQTKQPEEGHCTATTQSGEPCKVTNSVEDGLCAVHRRALVAA